jgi:8-oxo-dGTP pyrophosphatase MutT (NUDIX family)
LVLLRDGHGAVELLLARRHASLSFHGGAWVFPGGRVEPIDAGSDGDELAAARRAAIREACEEVGLAPHGEPVAFAHWTTPVDAPKRFATWFFAARAAADAFAVDGGEIDAGRWLAAEAALAAQAAHELELPPAVFVTLTSLRAFRTVDEALTTLAARAPERFVPRPHLVGDGTCSLYQDDAGYADGALARPGPRHRLWMLASGWRYERS